MATLTPALSLELAKRHLERVQDSWDPPRWIDLATFGFYALEAAVVAAAMHVGYTVVPIHSAKAKLATDLSTNHGLPDVSDLLRDLNEARKSEAYGDVEFPTDLDAEEVAIDVEAFVEAVDKLINP